SRDWSSDVCSSDLDEWLPPRGRSAQGNEGGYRARDRTRLTGPLALLSESGRERRSGDRPGLAGLGFDIAALRAFKRDRGQAAAHVGARVDADAVAAIFGSVADRMAMHDHFAVAVRMGQERLADPA